MSTDYGARDATLHEADRERASARSDGSLPFRMQRYTLAKLGFLPFSRPQGT